MQSITNVSQEIWRDIIGYEGLYQVSNQGKVKSLERIILCRNQACEFYRTYPEKILAPHRIDGGYLQVFLSKDGQSKAHLIHRLVAEAFIPNPENKPEVNHKDRNKSKNHADNLEWCTKLENMQHAVSTGWDPKQSRKGRKNSEFHNQRISETHRGKKATDELRNMLQHSHVNQSKACRCLETGQEFISFAEAGRCYNIDPTTISEAIRKNRRIKGQYTFVRTA